MRMQTTTLSHNGRDESVSIPADVFWLPGVVGVACAIVHLLTSRLWVTPDSTAYLSLAMGLAENGDFSQASFQLRLPGYPLLLAGVFRLFGSASATGILITQHVMVVVMSMLVAGIFYSLHASKRWAVVAGLLSATSPYVAGYANAVLTEVPYGFMLTLTMFFLIRFVRTENPWLLAGASLAAGCAALIKDVGQYAFVLCTLVLLAMLCRPLLERLLVHLPGAPSMPARVPHGDSNGRSTSGRRGPMLRLFAFAIVPGLFVLGPVMALNLYNFGRIKANANHGLLYYYRAGCLDELDDPASAAQQTIRQRVADARQRGWIPADATHHDYIPTVMAMERHLGHHGSVFESGRLAEIGDVLREAGTDLMKAYPERIAFSVMRDTYRILMMPDDGYRMQPGGQFSENRLAPEHELHAPTTYVAAVRAKPGMQRLNRYLRFGNEPGPLTHAVTPILTTHRTWKERASLPFVVADTPYEGLMLMAGLGWLSLLWMPASRPIGCLVGFVVFYHALGSAFMGGVQPRYIIPVHPLVTVLLGAGLAAAWNLAYATYMQSPLYRPRQALEV
ncbi:MAG: ArnT family glycosyltransferase [Phycisphaerae bacterium]